MPRVLIVDDSSTIRSMLGRVLGEHGWQVDYAEDGQAGATQALSSPPDAVVSGLWLPGLSGLQLCRLLHEDPATSRVIVLLVSATSDRRSRFWAARSGASAFIDQANLREVPEVLARLRSRSPSPPRPAATPRPVRASSVPGRLSQLLDRALFDTVLASEIRGLALDSADLAGLFGGLSNLVNDVLQYRWLALAVDQGDSCLLCLHAHRDAERDATREALAALRRDAAATPVVLADTRCAPPAARAAGVLSRVVEHGGTSLGALAMGVTSAGPRPDEAALLSLVAREVALPLRLVALMAQNRQLAATDELTSLPNRRTAVDVLNRATAAAARYDQALSVILLDVDHFKRVNDTHGHRAGDLVLQRLATVLARIVRASDLAARWGGEEFLVVLPSTGEPGARVAAERLRAAIAATPVLLEDGTTLRVTASLGVATYEREATTALVERADRALYCAKRNGRNRVEVAPPGARS